MKLKKLAGDQVVQSNHLPASASKVPGGPVFSGQIFPCSLASLLPWECVPTAQRRVSSADVQIQDRLIVSVVALTFTRSSQTPPEETSSADHHQSRLMPFLFSFFFFIPL